ncbi:hypothetical protein [Nocardia sp. Root136]|uniref:hypothetical protein n=1 Tax=Nocardia sp. Root136 TaxID=1736458 RepID=UPI000A902B48|nr:hypothetical protein [Nocardia sp. Root136]
MSFITTHTSLSRGILVSYTAPRPASYDENTTIPAYFSIELDMKYGGARLALTAEDARALLEQLPRLVMEHDAAEHVRAEQVAAEKSATEPKAA